MGKDYTTYKNALHELNMESLEKRREILCLRFARNCLKNEKVKKLFPLKNSDHKMTKRKEEKFKMKNIKTKRLQVSALPYMRKLLNKEAMEKANILKNLN